MPGIVNHFSRPVEKSGSNQAGQASLEGDHQTANGAEGAAFVGKMTPQILKFPKQSGQ